jgi:hypothetical protein
MKPALWLLTAWNLLCPTTLAALAGLAWAFDLSIGGGTFMDVGVFLFAWAWMLGTPIVSIAAVALSWKLRARLALMGNLFLLALWAAGSTWLLFLVPGTVSG